MKEVYNVREIVERTTQMLSQANAMCDDNHDYPHHLSI